MSQLTIRLPDELHAELELAARASRRSLNAEILLRLESEKIPDVGSGEARENPRPSNRKSPTETEPRKSPDSAQAPEPAIEKIPERRYDPTRCRRDGCELERDGASPFCADHRVRV